MLLHSEYRIVTCNDSLIYHVHRSTLKGFFNQGETWGHGEVLLQKKYKAYYRDRIGDPTGEILREYSLLFRSVIRKFPSMLFYKLILKDERSMKNADDACVGSRRFAGGPKDPSSKKNFIYK
jgi:hypothetical protein